MPLLASMTPSYHRIACLANFSTSMVVHPVSPPFPSNTVLGIGRQAIT